MIMLPIPKEKTTLEKKLIDFKIFNSIHIHYTFHGNELVCNSAGWGKGCQSRKLSFAGF